MISLIYFQSDKYVSAVADYSCTSFLVGKCYTWMTVKILVVETGGYKNLVLKKKIAYRKQIALKTNN